MAEQTGRQPFRFSLPWATNLAPTPPRAQIEPQQSPTQPTTITPIQRRLFRPPGSAPLQPRSQSRVQMSSETNPPSPSRTTPQSRAASKPPSPSRTTPQSRAASQPPSPSRKLSESQPATQIASQPQSASRTTSQSQATSQAPSRSKSQSQAATRTASQPPSPSRRASRPQPALQTTSQLQPPQTATQPGGQTSSQLPSPSLTASQVQQTTQAASQLPSPSKQAHKLQPTIRASSQPSPAPKASQPPSPSTSLASQHESSSGKASQTQPALSESLPQEPQPQPQAETTAPTSRVDPNTPVKQQKSDSSAITVALTQTPISETTSEDNRAEKQKAKSEPKKEEKSNDPADEESKPMMITEPLNMASGSNTQTKGQSAITSQAEQRKTENQVILNKKETAATGFKGRESKTGVTNPKDKNTGSESHQKSTTYKGGERTALHKEIKEDVSRFVHKLAVEPSKEPIDERVVSVITLAGENRGASMHMGSETAKREGSIHINRGYKLNKADNAEETTDGESSSNGRRLNDIREYTVTMVPINSNIQNINNSIVYNSSVTGRNPGVHLVLSRNTAEPIKSKHKTKSIEAPKADLNIAPTQTLTSKPTVRRRCLRALFMEPSDSDPDNPAKPRHHGCRYSCKEKKGRDNGNGASTSK